jgi:hypothetical protein
VSSDAAVAFPFTEGNFREATGGSYNIRRSQNSLMFLEADRVLCEYTLIF